MRPRLIANANWLRTCGLHSLCSSAASNGSSNGAGEFNGPDGYGYCCHQTAEAAKGEAGEGAVWAGSAKLLAGGPGGDGFGE